MQDSKAKTDDKWSPLLQRNPDWFDILIGIEVREDPGKNKNKKRIGNQTQQKK